MARGFASGAYMSIAHSAENAIVGGDFTVAMWINPTSLGSSSQQLLYKQNGGDEEFALRVKAGVSLWFPSVGGATDAVLVDPGLSASGWQHIAMRRTGITTCSIWIDGVQNASWTQSATTTGTSNWFMGSDTFGTDYDGAIAEFGMWNTDLSDGEIATLARAMRPDFVRRASLIMYMPLLGNDSPENDLWKGYKGTISSATKQPHCRIFWPSSQRGVAYKLPASPPTGPNLLTLLGVG